MTVRKDNTLLHKDKRLSTSWLFYKSVPDDKHSNTQYVKQEYKQLLQTKIQQKKKLLLSKSLQHMKSAK